MTAILEPDMRRERDEEIARLTRIGWSAEKIGERFNLSTRTVVRIRRAMGVAKPPPNYMTADELRRADQMLDDGASFVDVAETLGRAVSTIAARFPGRSQFPRYGGGGMMRHLLRQLDAIPVVSKRNGLR